MKKSKKHKIIILGGGLAGLAAAYELARNHNKVIVVERWKQVGGLARTIEVDGFRFDTGPHRWYTKSNKVNDWMLKIMEDEVVRVPRLTRIYFDKKFFYYPIKLMNTLTSIGLLKAMMGLFDYAVARIKARLFSQELITMEDGYINQFGKTLYETFFKRYSEKLWGQNCRQISIDWVGQRTRGLNFFTILKETFFKSKNVVSFVDEFSYPEKGIGRIAEKLAEEVIRLGGEILIGTEVVHVNTKNNRIQSVTVRKNKEKILLQGDYYISSIALDDLVKTLMPKADKEILTTASKLQYRDELQVALFVKKTHITPDTWIYVHPKELPFMRVMEMDNWSDKLSPPLSTTLVFEIACNKGDSMWKKDDKEVISLVADTYIREFKLISKKDIIKGYVHRVPKEYPVYHIGYKQDVDKIKRFLFQFINFQVVGRNGTFRYNNMDHSIEMGLYAAWNIMKGRKEFDIETVNIEREYLEEKKFENIEDEKVE